MRIVFITEKFPYPLDTGGKIRTYYMLKGLSREHGVTLLTTLEREEQQAYIPVLEQVCADVKVVRVPSETLLQLGLKIIKNLFSSVPIVVERHYSSVMAQEIETLLHNTQNKFDVAHFDHLDSSIFGPGSRPTCSQFWMNTTSSPTK